MCPIRLYSKYMKEAQNNKKSKRLLLTVNQCVIVKHDTKMFLQKKTLWQPRRQTKQKSLRELQRKRKDLPISRL